MRACALRMSTSGEGATCPCPFFGAYKLAGFWVGPKYTFLADGAFVLSSELGPDVSWVNHRHADAVRAHGVDGFVVPASAGPAFSRRLESLGVGHVAFRIRDFVVVSNLERPVGLDEVAGYEQGDAVPWDEDEGPDEP